MKCYARLYNIHLVLISYEYNLLNKQLKKAFICTGLKCLNYLPTSTRYWYMGYERQGRTHWCLYRYLPDNHINITFQSMYFHLRS